ncbi:glycosyl hydrolase family 2 [Haloactinopolyspora alba]|uniref:Glycosyl hydrolase family 2 n=1 Tax=Haloactinopolyspora alba TaxID=648780 RepID=A0A2P8E900_9ACTN|nr:PA14 domain-containing protein [Haloactinopolyspora alba]PSL05945.1 glycosyl hydrolase family 2 [Haloactinopolyspora alba]
MRRRRTSALVTAALAALVAPLTAVAAGPASAGPAPDTAAPDTAAADETPRHGLKGEYYTSSAEGVFDFDELHATILDRNIEFGDLNPIFDSLTGQADGTAARWTGRLQPSETETYTFSMIGDNGFRLWIDGELMIDNWVDNWDVEKFAEPITLEAGRMYDIKVEMFENWGGSHLRLFWQSPSQDKQVVPADNFYVPEGWDPPGPRSAELVPDGTTLSMDFDEALAPLPDGSTEHFSVEVGGTPWPATAATRDEADPSIVDLELEEPIPGVGDPVIRATYDGEGGVTAADGADLEAFNVPVENNSTYTIKTRWADDVDPDNPLPEYPRPQMTRDEWQNLNGTWQFAAAEEGEAPPFGQTLDEEIVVPYPVESELSELQRHEERMWYRRTFTVPEKWSGQRLKLNFGAVDYKATVYVNGEQVATHSGGYDAFTADITDALRPGGEQELIVRVEDPTDEGNQPVGKQRLNPGGIFYTSVSGIWQTVWMEPVPDASVTRLDMTPDVAAESLDLTVRAEGTTDQVVVATAYKGKKPIGSVSGAPGEKLSVPVPKPKLWSPRKPFLYDLKVQLRDADTGEVVDSVGSYFGMRTVSKGMVDGTMRMLLNGKPVYQHGPLDQGFWPDGIYTAPTDEALKYDIEQTKRMGFNTIRKHVKVEPARWYYWADKLGVIVWQDMPSMARTPDEAGRQQFEHELQEMVTENRSHPSITMWVPFNEAWGIYDAGRIADEVKAWDPSRLVSANSGSNNFPPDPGNGDLVDDHIYVGPGTPRPPSNTRASVLSEYGGLALSVFGHQWTGTGWGYNTEPDKEALTNRYLQLNERLKELAACNGLSGSIYTQTTDVETELNGLMTYDREVDKMNVGAIRASNLELINSGSHPECTE